MENWAGIVLLALLSYVSYCVGASRGYVAGHKDGRRSAMNERIGK